MLEDGFVPGIQALQPRQSVGSSSILITPSLSQTRIASEVVTSTTSHTALAASSIVTPQPIISTISTEVNINDDETCTAALPAGGYIMVNDTLSYQLDESAIFVAPCANHSIFNSSSCSGGNATIVNQPDHFYASTSPNVYALATATVISYVLVILIFITPRTFYVGGPGGTSGTAGGAGAGFRTFFPGTAGRNTSIIGIGRRPLLQKIAALTVAVSLTIATTDTFRKTEEQYNSGYIDSKTLVDKVVGSLEVRITRVISDTFLWLAQVQTLIRLFPRHKEKVTIKWLGFGLVLCDTVFSILENFVSSGEGTHRTDPGHLSDAIPALSYLFELSIGLIYASCVLYYALSKRRFAFWHSKMRNICLVALLSVVAVLIPVVFFITDLAQPEIATWGEYIRWVGAAAASVVVWEWVERIETLERDEKKDGILGREIFDGDEMLDLTPSEDEHGHGSSSRPTNGESKKSSRFWQNVKELNVDIQPRIPLKKLKNLQIKSREKQKKKVSLIHSGPSKLDPDQITRPPQAITPISRSDTNSAASTVYAVRYHDPFSPSPAIPEEGVSEVRRRSVALNVPPAISDESTLTNSTSTTMDQRRLSGAESIQAASTGRQLWQGVANPFKRKRAEPPAEVAAQIVESNLRRSPIDRHLNLRNRLNAFTTQQKSKFGGRPHRNRTPLAVTVIPAQPRGPRMDSEESDLQAESDMLVTDVPAEAPRPQPPEPSSPDLNSLPVTVIPPPVRGGRTWSPDDLAHEEQATPPPPDGDSLDNQAVNQASESTNNSQGQLGIIHSQRGALTISESPGRLRDTTTPNNGTPSILRRSRNSRSATITSINDRLSTASPAAASRSPGPRPATTDSSGPPRSGTTDSTGR